MQTEAGASLNTTDASGSRGRGRVTRPALTAVVLGLGLLVWTLDRLSKEWALRELTPGVVRPLLGEFLQLTLLFNPGAAFSLGTGVTPVFTVIQAIVSVAVVIAAFRVGSAWWALGLGLVLGGASGNLTDRLTRPPGFGHGHVVDFLMLPNWPVFNLADSAICVAAAVLAVVAFRGIGFDGSREGAPARGSGSGPDSGDDSGSDSGSGAPSAAEESREQRDA